METNSYKRGFTIVEILIVVVVIAVIATLAIVGYGAMQKRARDAQLNADLRTLRQAIEGARHATGAPMVSVTGVEHTGADCLALPSGTDIKSLPKTHSCWTRYITALDNLSKNSGVDVRNMLDPWGRPYFIYESEDTYAYASDLCKKDEIGVLGHPHVQWYKQKLYYIGRVKVGPSC